MFEIFLFGKWNDQKRDLWLALEKEKQSLFLRKMDVLLYVLDLVRLFLKVAVLSIEVFLFAYAVDFLVENGYPKNIPHLSNGLLGFLKTEAVTIYFFLLGIWILFVILKYSYVRIANRIENFQFCVFEIDLFKLWFSYWKEIIPTLIILIVLSNNNKMLSFAYTFLGICLVDGSIKRVAIKVQERCYHLYNAIFKTQKESIVGKISMRASLKKIVSVIEKEETERE